MLVSIITTNEKTKSRVWKLCCKRLINNQLLQVSGLCDILYSRCTHHFVFFLSYSNKILFFLQVPKGIKNLEKLKILDVSHCTCITDEGLKKICQLRNLTSLNINMCTQVGFFLFTYFRTVRTSSSKLFFHALKKLGKYSKFRQKELKNNIFCIILV